MRRDLAQILLAGLLLLLGYAMMRLGIDPRTGNTQIGGWRETCAVVGGILFVAMLIVLPVAVIAATIRHARAYFAYPS